MTKERWLAGFMNERILEVKDLSIEFKSRERRLLSGRKYEAKKRVLDKISFTLKMEETYGIIGETGSGKSTLARTLVGINKPVEGRVTLLGRDINFGKKEDVLYLRKNIGIVFQDPIGSLNPKLTVFQIIEEGLNPLGKISKAVGRDRIEEVASLVEIPKSKLAAYPDQLSGGERQRVSLARTIIEDKKILILDEPTSSLDVSIQAQILNLLRKIKDELSVSYIFITHDFNVIKYMCDTLSVLYFGKLLETGSVREIYERPLHPYTSDLMDANITLTQKGESVSELEVREPSREGCVYKNTCTKRFSKCDISPPEFHIDSRIVRCWLYEDKNFADFHK
jgi:oligopeptide/dipeptide ABC transporter ATP-binding protein